MADEGDIDRLIQRLRERVEERRASGEYPDGLEDDIDRHYREVVARGMQDPLRRLHTAVAEAERTAELRADAIPADSDLPGGRLLHRIVARLVGRQVEGVLMQVRDHARSVLEVQRAELFALNDLSSRIDDLRTRSLEAGGSRGDPGTALADLDARVRELEMDMASQRGGPWSAPPAPTLSPTLLAAVTDHLGAASRVEVFGACDPVVGALGDRAVEVVSTPADTTLGAVSAAGPRTFDAVLVSYVFETLRPDQQIELVALLADRLADGGAMAVVAVDPQASASTTRPMAVVHPAYLAFLFTEAGFGGVTVHWPEGEAGGSGADAEDGGSVERLRARLFGASQYVLTATG